MLEDLPRMDRILHHIEVCHTAMQFYIDIVKLHTHIQPCAFSNSHVTYWSSNVIDMCYWYRPWRTQGYSCLLGIFVPWKHAHTIVQYQLYCFLPKPIWGTGCILCTDVLLLLYECFYTAVNGHRAGKCRPCIPLPGGQWAGGSVRSCVQCESFRGWLCGSCSCGERTLMSWRLHKATRLHTSGSCLL